ncbi:MAG: 3-deoxy-D-manno-octulosonic acid transferase [SAR86 cluster bacterium]|nr:3-deoxy-D-manno-octulosonic acid transferase [SAR86 cluster bacterium]
MKLVIYNLLILMLVPIFALRILFKSLADKDYRNNFPSRLGFNLRPIIRNKDKLIWFHAVSLGEVIGSQDIIRQLIQKYDVVITTSTPTGLRKARKLFQDEATIDYAPWDFLGFINRFFNFYKPDAVIIFETEIWPSMISQSAKKNIPFYLVNGRLSKKSYQAYAMSAWLMKDTLQKITFAFVQTEKHKERFLKLGIDQKNIQVAGSVKFDAPGLKAESLQMSPFILGASTHPGEDEMLLDAFKKLLKTEGLKLCICPRHPERSSKIINQATSMGLSAKLYSKLSSQDFDVCIVDSIGELPGFYLSAVMAFVGGSLVPRGGHNLIEPAVLGTPIIIGPHTFNFEDIVSKFLQDEACIEVTNGDELTVAMQMLLDAPEKAQQLSEKAQRVVAKNKGSTEIQASYIINKIGEMH